MADSSAESAAGAPSLQLRVERLEVAYANDKKHHIMYKYMCKCEQI